MNLPYIRSFSNSQEAQVVQKKVEENMPLILADTSFKTTKILHDDPEVWRVWWQLGEVRVALHKIFPCVDGECFFHPHPWPSTVRCLK
jgi:hypothetical protein